MTDVLLMGYYGRANFGDDVLMLVSYRLLREAMPSARIRVIVEGPSADYVAHLLPDAEIIRPGYHVEVDYIIHGGGGVFFDFASHALPQRLLGGLLETVGYPAYLALERSARQLMGKPRTRAARRLGLGIGVGTFSAGSPRLREKLHALGDFDALWLRDEESEKNLRRFSSVFNGEIIRGSDLAFLRSYWGARARVSSPAGAKPKLGVILRDWPAAQGGATPTQIATSLESIVGDYALTVFIFDEHADAMLKRALHQFPVVSWNPAITSIDDFTAALAAQDVVLTSRAHGAICSACLGVPSVILPIEPKLHAVHGMLSQSSVLVPTLSAGELKHAISQALTIAPEAIARDVERNRAASQAALHHISRWFT